MKYQLTMHGWPIGQFLIPVGTVIDIPAKDGDDWSALATDMVPPINAQALDAQAWNALVRAYGARKLVMKGF